MLAVDTNVIVRLLVRDHPVQSSRAFDLLSGNDVWAPVTVVLEAEWVLRSAFGYARAQFADAIVALIGLPRLELQHAAAVLRAVALHRDGVDFADALHLALADKCIELATFDRRFVARAERLGLPVRPI